MKISKKQKDFLFLMSQGSLNPRFLGQKVCPVACYQTHRQNDYCGHPFRVSGFFPSTYHQGSAQQPIATLLNIIIGMDCLRFYTYQLTKNCQLTKRIFLDSSNRKFKVK